MSAVGINDGGAGAMHHGGHRAGVDIGHREASPLRVEVVGEGSAYLPHSGDAHVAISQGGLAPKSFGYRLHGPHQPESGGR